MKLKDALPKEFLTEFQDTEAYKYAEIEVLTEVDSRVIAWPGTHKNVNFWVALANGKAVGWNENPARGWSFPVVKYERKITRDWFESCHDSNERGY